MASFTQDEVDRHALDWQILRNGGISLYRRSDLLKADVTHLESLGYRMKNLDTSRWITDAAMHEDLSRALEFPAYYGGNLAALNDCMTVDLVVPTSGGLAVCLWNVQAFANRSTLASAVLDICAKASRIHMLEGKRLIVLLHSDDPRITFTGLGGIDAQWNRKEWLNAARGL